MHRHLLTKILVACLLALLYGFRHQEKIIVSHPAPKAPDTAFHIPRIKDNLPVTRRYYSPGSVSVTMTSLVEAVQPFGNNQLLQLSKRPGINYVSAGRYEDRKLEGLKALVDVNTVVSMNAYLPNVLNDQPGKKGYYKSYPCYVYNETGETKGLELQDGYLPAILEARDSSGNWRPIQAWLYSWCGNSYEFFALPAKHYLVFKIPVFNGSYTTALRVKIKNYKATYYSNTFPGKIDYRQFTIPESLADKVNPTKLTGNYSFLDDDRY